MSKNPIKAIFFDLGNVIVRFDLVIVEKEYAAFCRNKIREGQFVDYVMGSYNVDKYMEGKLTSSQFYNKTRRLFKMDIKYAEFYRIWNSMFYPYAEMEEIIKTIKKNYPEIKLILLSNTNEAHYEFLIKEYETLNVMDAHVVSHEVGRQKPHVAIYNKALRTAGSIPKNTFYTDDRPELIDAARVLGIRAFQFTGHKQLKKQLAKYEINV